MGPKLGLHPGSSLVFYVRSPRRNPYSWQAEVLSAALHLYTGSYLFFLRALILILHTFLEHKTSKRAGD